MTQNSIAGELDITVSWRAGVVTRVDIRNTRPALLARVFIGRPLAQVLALMPQLFSVCAVAQQVAALRAAESRLGLVPCAEAEMARQRLLDAEMIRELGLQAYTHWLVDDQSRKIALLRWFNEAKAALGWALVLADENLKPATHWQDSVQALWHRLPLPDALRQQTDATVLLKLMQPEILGRIERLAPVELGKPATWLNIHESSVCQWISDELKAEGAEQFGRLPDLQGEPQETGASPVACTSQRADVVILQRLLGRLMQLQVLSEETDTMPVMPHGLSDGVGMVEAARGVLLHHLCITSDDSLERHVQAYNIVAPTEWNFHPSGTLVKMLEGVAVAQDDLELLVAQLVGLIDPCVGWSLKVDAHHA